MVVVVVVAAVVVVAVNAHYAGFVKSLYKNLNFNLRRVAMGLNITTHRAQNGTKPPLTFKLSSDSTSSLFCFISVVRSSVRRSVAEEERALR